MTSSRTNIKLNPSAVFVVLVLGAGLAAGQFCEQDDYSPCICYDWTVGLDIACFSVPIDEVYDIFHPIQNHVNSNYHRVRINLNEADDSIKADILGSHTTKILEISCPVPSVVLHVDEMAFESTKDIVTSVEVNNCDLTELDFKFLNGFDNLETLIISSSHNLPASFNTLPLLPKLTTLEIHHCSKLDQLESFPTLNGIQSFLLYENPDLGDESVENILTWMGATDSLVNLGLNANNLTRIPNGISNFLSLESLELQNNKIPVVRTGQLSFTAPVKSLFLYSDELETIEKDSFKGDFSKAVVISLLGNRLKSFDQSVFGEILKQLKDSGSSTKINVDQNPFDCSDCQLSWLVKDNPYLLDYVDNAKCSDGKFFTDLKASDFKACEVLSPSTAMPPPIGSASQLVIRLEWLLMAVLFLRLANY